MYVLVAKNAFKEATFLLLWFKSMSVERVLKFYTNKIFEFKVFCCCSHEPNAVMMSINQFETMVDDKHSV